MRFLLVNVAAPANARNRVSHNVLGRSPMEIAKYCLVKELCIDSR